MSLAVPLGCLFAALLGLPPGADESSSGLTVESVRGLRAEAAARLLSGDEGGNLPAVAHFAAPLPKGQGLHAPLSVEVPGSLFHAVRDDAEGDSLEETALEITVYVLGDDLSLHGHLAERLVHRGGPLPKGVRWNGAVELPVAVRGRPIEVRLLLSESPGRRSMLQTRRFSAAGSPAPRLGAPAAMDGDWLTLSADSNEASRDTSPVGDPPVTVPVLTPGRQRLEMLGDSGGAESLELRLWDRVEQVALLDARVTETGTALEIDVPELRSGRYRWQLGADPGAAGELWVLRESAASAARSLAGSHELDWLDAQRWFEQQLAEASARDLTSIDQVAPAARLEEGFARALRELGSHWQLEQAARNVATVEGRALRSELDPPTIERLEAVLLHDLVKRSPRAALAALAVLVEGYGLARAEDRYADAGRARRLAQEVADRVSTRFPSEAADQLALLSLKLAEYGLWPTVQVQLEAAVDKSPDHAEARALLAAVLERQGLVERARQHAQAAFELDRGLHLNRLRLAALLRREGRPARAEPHLRALLGESADDVVRSLACQELAVLLTEDRRLAEASEQLTRCAGGSARDGELLALQVHVAELRGRAQRARSLLEAARRARTDPTARSLYAEVPPALATRLSERAERTFRLHAGSLTEAFSSP